MRARTAALVCCWLAACAEAPVEEPPPPPEGDELPDAAPDDRDDPADAATEDVSQDVADESAMDAASSPDAPREDRAMDVAPPRDVALDRAALDAPREAAVDRVAPTDTAPVPVPRPADVRPGAACHDLLRRLGLRFTVAGATRGVEDPVSVTTPIEGVHYRYASYTAADRALLMDCRLAVALVRLSRELRDRWDITDVQHIGIYNYRTIAGSTRLSQHAYAMAIDLGGFRDRRGTTYSVLTDFVMGGTTCPVRGSNARDRTLKEIACWMYDSRTFHIILTPNYNAAHRNHYHVDLTAGSHTVRVEVPEGVDPPHDPFLDWLYDDE